jgi:hypothetical protein
MGAIQAVMRRAASAAILPPSGDLLRGWFVHPRPMRVTQNALAFGVEGNVPYAHREIHLVLELRLVRVPLSDASQGDVVRHVTPPSPVGGSS